jgi:hypothetical protein
MKTSGIREPSRELLNDGAIVDHPFCSSHYPTGAQSQLLYKLEFASSHIR